MTLCSHSNNMVHIFIYVCMSNKIFFFCFFGYLWSIPGRCWNISNSLPVNMGDLHSTDVRIPIYWCGYGHIKPPSCITRVHESIVHTEPYLTILRWGRVISGPRTWEIHGTKIQPYYYNQISSFVVRSRHRSCPLFVKLLSDDGDGCVETFQFGPDVVWVICHDRNQSQWLLPYETNIWLGWDQWNQGPRQRRVSIVQWTSILWRDLNVCHSSMDAPIFELVS